MANRKSGPTLTRERAAHIKYLLETTNMNHAQIAAEVGSINQGRVSEVKNGKRFANVSASEYGGGN